MALQIRRGTNAERQIITPLSGELLYTTDTKELWIGDGTTLGGVPAVPAEQALDVVGPALEDGTHYNITFTYDDAAGTINASVSTKLSDDTDPALGGNLNSNGYNITEAGDVTANSITSSTITAQDFIGASLSVSSVTTSSITAEEGASSISINSPISVPSVTSNFVGSLYSDDSTTIVNGITGDVYANNLTIGVADISNSTITLNNNTSTAIIINKTGDVDSSIQFKNTGTLGINDPIAQNGKLGSFNFTAWTGSSFDTVASLTAAADGELVDNRQPTKFEIKTQPADSIFTNTLLFDSKGTLSAKILSTGTIYSLASIDYVTPGAIVLDSSTDTPKFVGCTSPSVGVVGDPGYIAPTWVDLSNPQIVATNYADDTERNTSLSDPAVGTIVYNVDLGRFQGYNGSIWIDLNT